MAMSRARLEKIMGDDTDVASTEDEVSSVPGEETTSESAEVMSIDQEVMSIDDEVESIGDGQSESEGMEDVNTEEQQQEALRQYCEHFGKDICSQQGGSKEDLDLDDNTPEATFVRTPEPECLSCGMHDQSEFSILDFDEAEYSDGEEVMLCRHCKLPLGELGYTYGDDDESPVHGECAAQLMLGEFRTEVESRKVEESTLKEASRIQYDIGWHVEEAPRNALAVEQMGCHPAPQGMCCLVYDEDSHSVHVAPTLEPAESLNLEYLSLSLRIRLREGREPLFSLDPVDGSSTCEKEAMQVKRFEPEWIAGTSVGEIMFQADYHLKELSMGEYSQPVVGMRSAFDFSEKDAVENEWSGREWFIVRKAEVLLTEGSVVVPRVKMGVEAREQVLQGDQFVDVKSTRKDHPLVKYADAFTHNFDLIAERKSVVFHLRELAKASVVAKMLIDGAVNLDGPWFDLGGQGKEVCSLEIPQLWLQREYTQIRVLDGNILKDDEGGVEQRRCRGLYGGVNFGLERAAVSMPSVVSRGRISSLSARPALSRLSAATKPSASVAAVGVSMPSLITRGRMSLVSKPAALTTKLAPAASVAAAGVSMPSMISRGRMASLAARPAVGLSAVTAPSVSAAAARPAVGLSSVTAGLARPATGLASVTAGLAPRPAVSLQTSKMMTVTQTRAPGLMPQRPSVGLSAVTTARPAAGLSAVTTRLAAPARPAAGISAVTARLSAAARPAAGLSAAQTRLGAAARPASALSAASFPQRLGVAPAAGLSAVVSGDARGVDLNLDQFSLSSPMRMEEAAVWNTDRGVKCSSMGSAFWASLDGDGSHFCPEDRKLLKAIYDPNLSDRRDEGDLFVPPDTRFDYVQKLRKLVGEETTLQEKRITMFLSAEFAISSPGLLFPASWAPSGEIANTKLPAGPLHACTFKDQVDKFERMLTSMTPAFDKTTEEGMRFRIYTFGDMEVRTTQEAREGSKQIVGAVFSKTAPSVKEATLQDSADEDWSKLVKATEYVEWAKDGRRSFVVLETAEGNVIVTEKLADGKIAWETSPVGLDYRNAVAKVIRCADCLEKGIAATSLKWEMMGHQTEQRASCSDSKNYAHVVYSRALGESFGNIYTGFRKKQ